MQAIDTPRCRSHPDAIPGQIQTDSMTGGSPQPVRHSTVRYFSLYWW